MNFSRFISIAQRTIFHRIFDFFRKKKPKPMKNNSIFLYLCNYYSTFIIRHRHRLVPADLNLYRPRTFHTLNCAHCFHSLYAWIIVLLVIQKSPFDEGERKTPKRKRNMINGEKLLNRDYLKNFKKIQKEGNNNN